MTHFLHRPEISWRARYLTRQRAAVTCKVERVDGEEILRIHPGEGGGISVLKLGVAVAPLPERVKVVGPNGEPVKPMGAFWVTLETFDPFHLVLDHPDP